jgi:hypothetical protein
MQPYALLITCWTYCNSWRNVGRTAAVDGMLGALQQLSELLTVNCPGIQIWCTLYYYSQAVPSGICYGLYWTTLHPSLLPFRLRVIWLDGIRGWCLLICRHNYDWHAVRYVGISLKWIMRKGGSQGECKDDWVRSQPDLSNKRVWRMWYVHCTQCSL